MKGSGYEKRTPGGRSRLEVALEYARARRDWVETMASHDAGAVAELRAGGLSWERISVAFGGVPTAQTLRRLYGSQEGS